MYQVSPWLIAVVAVCFILFFVFIISRLIKTHKTQAYTGKEELIGARVEVRTTLNRKAPFFSKVNSGMRFLKKDVSRPVKK